MDYLTKLNNLENKVVAITGGTGVLAGEMAKGFLLAGSKVILLGRHEAKLKRRVETLSQISPEVTGFRCNVLHEDGMNNARQTILDRHGHLDVLVNAAGGNMPAATIGVDQTFFDLKIEDFNRVTRLNLNGTVLPTLIFGRLMADQKSGAIINISSMASSRAITRVVGYSAAKAAIDNFTRWLACELAEKFNGKVRVNAIAPGFLITKQNRELLTNPDGSLTDRGKTVLQKTPFKRFGEPEELVGTILFLAGDASRFVTGTVIPVDGGFSAFSGV